MARYYRPREWQQRGREVIAEELLQEKIVHLRKETGLSSLTLRALVLRGHDTPEKIKTFLSPQLKDLVSPFQIKDLSKAVDRLVQAREQGESIRVYGDYDVDGTAGAALLTWIFRDFGFDVTTVQPNRFTDGYGLNPGAVEAAHTDGIRLMVTIDCGISSFEAADRAAELGVELIVVDHHQIDPKRGLPQAVAIVNPQREDCPSGLRQLCGCGLGFYLAMGLRARGRELGWFEDGKGPNLKEHLDLVVMATAADQVPLTGDNRILVAHGLEVLQETKKPGVRALMEGAGIAQRAVSPGHLGYVIGPRINASGRLGSAHTALELLTTKDSAQAMKLAKSLEEINAERMEIQNEIWDQVRASVEKEMDRGRFRHSVVIGHSDWHEGVVGIVASKVTETFQRPAIVMAVREKDTKGSVRSYAGKNVLQALHQCSDHLAGYGGHPMAAGVSLATVDSQTIEAFADAFDVAIAEQVNEKENVPPLKIEGGCQMSELEIQTLKELEWLGPFGPGNPEPVFKIAARIDTRRILKGRHLKLRLADCDSHPDVFGRERKMEAIWFGAAEKEEILSQIEKENGLIDTQTQWEWAGVPELNRFRGSITPTLRVSDWKMIKEPSVEKGE